jgi:hypothetical protein
MLHQKTISVDLRYLTMPLGCKNCPDLDPKLLSWQEIGYKGLRFARRTIGKHCYLCGQTLMKLREVNPNVSENNMYG